MAYEYEEDIDDDKTEEEKEQDRIKQELLESLAASIEDKFQRRASNRRAKEQQWLRSAELYYGKLAFTGNLINRETPFELTSYANRPDVNVVRSKCSIAIAQTFSMQFGTGNKNWDLWPAKTNTDEQASAKAEAMSAVIEQQLDDSNYTGVCWKGMRDRVVLGTAVLKGPANVGKLVRSYVQLEGSTTWVPDVSVDYSPELKYVNPWFFYPDDTVEDLKNLGDTIEVHPTSPLDLKKLIKHEGFRPDAIECVLENKPEEYRNENWADFARLSENNANLFKGKYLLLEYRGPITRTQLDQIDIEPC